MYVRLNQIVLGSYIATFLYCLFVLNAIKISNDYTFIPSISIFVAILITIANIILLIIFIHQIAESIQADYVIADISGVILHQVETLFPAKMGEEMGNDENIDLSSAISGYQKHISVKSPKSGYVQYIDNLALIKIIAKQDAFLELNHRPGSFLVTGKEIAVLHFKTNMEKDVLENITNQFIIEKTKTSQQDLEFSIHQMVEIADRALSPGINNPYTAINCIDNLTTAMCYLAQAKFPSKYHFDEEGNLRIIADELDFEGVLDAVFNQIRQYSEGSTAVIIRLMEALITIYEFTIKENYKKAVIKHAEMVLRLGKKLSKKKMTFKTSLKEQRRFYNFEEPPVTTPVIIAQTFKKILYFGIKKPAFN